MTSRTIQQLFTGLVWDDCKNKVPTKYQLPAATFSALCELFKVGIRYMIFLNCNRGIWWFSSFYPLPIMSCIFSDLTADTRTIKDVQRWCAIQKLWFYEDSQKRNNTHGHLLKLMCWPLIRGIDSLYGSVATTIRAIIEHLQSRY